MAQNGGKKGGRTEKSARVDTKIPQLLEVVPKAGFEPARGVNPTGF